MLNQVKPGETSEFRDFKGLDSERGIQLVDVGRFNVWKRCSEMMLGPRIPIHYYKIYEEVHQCFYSVKEAQLVVATRQTFQFKSY